MRELVDVIRQCLPIYARTLIAVAFILILQKPCFKHDHPKCPDVTLGRLFARRMADFLSQGISLLRTEIQVQCGSFVEEHVVVTDSARGIGVADLDNAIDIKQYHT